MLSIISKPLNFLKKRMTSIKVPKKKKSNVYALERLKETHNHDYSTFVANYYKKQNYTVWEYSKEKNFPDHEINLVVKKEADILLIQCKNNFSEISLENVVKFENEVHEFLSQYTLFQSYKLRYCYILPKYQFDKSASNYISNNHNINYKILKEHAM